jgi:NAD(P)-dependent dehydrogenase (short-subunit alcohol dehydrogenase family)
VRRLEGKVVVITGGGAGLGRATALLFAEEGARLVIGSRDAARVEATVTDVRSAGGDIFGRQMDVSQEDEVAALVADAVERFGKLDVMFNNAGIPVPGNGRIPFEMTTAEDWQRLLGVNLSGVFHGCKHAIAPMRANGGGSIINSSSGAAFATLPGWAPYAATKGGINALTRALAVDLGPDNIRVNAICPAIGVSSNFHQAPGSPVVDDDDLIQSWDQSGSLYPLKARRAPRLVDSAMLALFLASDESLFVTGQSMVVDGGLLSRMADPFTAEYRETQRKQRETPSGDMTNPAQPA